MKLYDSETKLIDVLGALIFIAAASVAWFIPKYTIILLFELLTNL